VIQANMLASRTKAALLSLEVIEHADDGPEADGAVSITVHLWRSEMMLGVVEVDREGLVAKAGCCALHQPGARAYAACTAALVAGVEEGVLSHNQGLCFGPACCSP
jgi:hypothetical protein